MPNKPKSKSRIFIMVASLSQFNTFASATKTAATTKIPEKKWIISRKFI
jgi:hypothetical protein